MGLDTSHDCWHGPYSSFHRWRIWLAERAGLPPLELMEGFMGATDHYAHVRIGTKVMDQYPWQGHSHEVAGLPISWDCLKPSPLDHIDGEVTETSKPACAIYDGMVPATERFIAGLRLAAEAKETVEFH